VFFQNNSDFSEKTLPRDYTMLNDLPLQFFAEPFGIFPMRAPLDGTTDKLSAVHASAKLTRIIGVSQKIGNDARAKCRKNGKCCPKTSIPKSEQ